MARRAATFPVEVGLPRFRITRYHVARLEHRRAAQRVVDALAQEVRQQKDVTVAQPFECGRTRGRPLLRTRDWNRRGDRWVVGAQIRAEGAAVAVLQDDERAHEIRTFV